MTKEKILVDTTRIGVYADVYINLIQLRGKKFIKYKLIPNVIRLGTYKTKPSTEVR